MNNKLSTLALFLDGLVCGFPHPPPIFTCIITVNDSCYFSRNCPCNNGNKKTKVCTKRNFIGSCSSIDRNYNCIIWDNAHYGDVILVLTS